MADYNQLVGSLFNGQVPDWVTQGISSVTGQPSSAPSSNQQTGAYGPTGMQGMNPSVSAPAQSADPWGAFGGQQPWSQMGQAIHPQLANWLSSYMGQQGQGQFGGLGNGQQNNLIAPYLGGMRSFGGLW